MLTKYLTITTTVLAAAAALSFSGGCSSAHDRPTRMANSRHHRAMHAQRSESPDYRRQDRTTDDDGYRPVEAPVVYAEDRAELTPPAGTEQNGQDANTKTENAETRNDRVTVISAEEPPLTLLETPSRTITQDEFWVAGHWIAGPSGFTWQDGRIERDRTGELFVDGGWSASPRGWEYTPEYWR
jgi:hypothetical protein